MAKSTSVDASTTLLIDQKADSEDVDALRERLAELEAEITTLRESAAATDVDSDDSELKTAYDHAMTTIDELMAEKQEVEAKVTSTVRRASVIVDPQRVEASIAEIGEVQISSDEAAKVVNETWTKRLNCRSSLIGDIGSTKDIITQLTNSTSTEVEEKFASVQVRSRTK